MLKVYTDRSQPANAQIPITPSRGWTSFDSPLPAITGEHALFFVYEGCGSLDFTAFEIS